MEKKEIENLLLEHRIREGMEGMKPLLAQCHYTQLSNQFATLEQNYTYMLSFLSRNGKDENRASMQQAIARKGLLLLDALQRQIRLEKNTDFYSKTYQLVNTQASHNSLIQHLAEWNQRDDVSIFQQEDNLFLAIWVSDFFDQESEDAFLDFFKKQKSNQKQYFLTALFLSCWEYFDPHKFTIFCHLMETEDMKEKDIAAHVAVLFALLCTKYQKRIPLFPELKIECPECISQYFYPIEKQLLLNRQGSLIRKYLAGEIMPQMKKQLDRYQHNELRFEEDNEWSELTEQFSDRLKELVNDGVDLNMDAMAQGLHHPFFSVISHWFLPFDEKRPEVASYFKKSEDGKPTLEEILIRFQSCDADRYAMALMIKQLPTIPAGLEGQVDEMREMISDRNAKSREPIRDILRSMYRFFTFSIWKNEFENPFETRKSLLDTPITSQYFTKEELLSYCHLAMRYYAEEEAYNHIESLILKEGASAEMLRMRGICKQKQERYASAIDDFVQADLLEEDEDTLDRLQKCFRHTERFSEQEECLYRLQDMNPQKKRYTNELANCMMVQGKYEDALKTFYRIEYENPSSEKAIRGILWCSLKLSKTETTAKYYQKMLSSNFKRTWEDYLNLGHIAFMNGNWADASNLYAQYLNTYRQKHPTDTIEQAIRTFDEDQDELLQHHICLSDIRLMRDIILSEHLSAT